MASENTKGKAAKTPVKTLKRLLAYTFSRYKTAAVFVVIFVMTASAANVVASSRLAVIIQELIVSPEHPSINMSVVWTNILVMGCIYIAGVLSSFAYNRIMMYIAQGTLKKLRDEMFAKMQYLPLKFFDTHTHGDLMSMYTNDVDTMRQLLSQTIPQIISSILTLIFVFAFMVFYSFTLTLLILAVLAVMIFVIKKVGVKSAKNFLKQQRAMGALNGYVEEMTEGQKVIKVFCHEDEAIKGFKSYNVELFKTGYIANCNAFLLGPVNNNLGYLQYVLVAVVGFILMVSGAEIGLLSGYTALNGGGIACCAGMLVSFLSYSRQFNMPVQQVSQQFNAIVMALAGAERIFDMVDTLPEDKGGETTLTYGEYEKGEWAWKKPNLDGTFEYVPLKGDIRFNDVVFGYTDEKVILKNVSLYAKPGQKIAFVGSTGAGKTTITNLINRFYDIQSGEITYDGLDIKSIKKDDLRRSLGVVLQDTHLFTGTVMDNIRYGRLGATDEECVKAAKLANAHSFIKHLPEGYNTVITGDGANLSQGQRQLLAISRAMVSECPVLILDEATSSIDTRTEKLIEQGMVLEHGEIIERGDHEQLIEQKGKYYQLYTGAFELE